MDRNTRLFTITALVALVTMLASACSPTALVTGTAASSAASAAAQPALAAAVVSSQNPQATSAVTLDSYQQVLEGIYARVSPSVVTINVQERSQFGFAGSQQALGSGFVWDAQGHIVTNNHVVDGAQTIQVTFPDGTSLPAKVVGTDPNTDLAVIQVNAPSSLLRPVQLGDSSKVVVGQVAIAIGNPFGEQNTMTVGIISAVGRSLPVQSSSFQAPSYTIPNVIQTDAAINPGNSGGVLLDENGSVIGVTSAIESASQSSSGVGFAIPSNMVSKVVPSLISSGQHQTPYLGISGTSLTSALAQAMGLDPKTQGALIEEVAPGGPAAIAGLLGSNQPFDLNGQTVNVGGDVVTAVNGTTIRSMDDLLSYIAGSTDAGQTITLGILRNGRAMELPLTLGARPAA